VFIKDCFTGAFCLFESMASMLPLVEEFIVLDLGSTDGTFEALGRIARANKRVKLRRGEWPVIDAGAFATLANDLIDDCLYDKVLYYQADEIWHEDLLLRTEDYFSQGRFELAFWRIQYRDNFQLVKWFPHLVHRVGIKGQFNFVGDGMSSDRTWDAEICSEYDGSYFQKWHVFHQEGIKPYVHDMIMDVSLVGAFRDNIAERRKLHAPFWHESDDIENKPPDQWLEQARANPAWTLPTSPYDMPAIMNWHVGRLRYELRPELLRALMDDTTWDYIKQEAHVTKGKKM